MIRREERARTDHGEREPSPIRVLVRRELRVPGRVRALDIQHHPIRSRTFLQRRIVHHRRDREAERRPELCERLEERAADALLVRETALRDEERACREHKIGAEHAEDRRGEAEGPVRRVGVDERKEQRGYGGDEGAEGWEGISGSSTRKEDDSSIDEGLYSPINQTKLTCATKAAMKTLHKTPVINIGMKRMAASMGL